MTDERRQDVLLFALVLSVMAHAALMFFMRPQVMTHVTGAGARSRARPPMKVREAVPPPDAVKFESVLDVDAERKSPEAEVDEPMPVAESFAAPEIAPEALARGGGPRAAGSAQDDSRRRAAPFRANPRGGWRVGVHHASFD